MATDRLLGFVEPPTFQSAWASLGLTLVDLFELQRQLQATPRAGPVMAGTSGLRKIRFSPSRLRRGKRGAFRVCYVVFERLA